MATSQKLINTSKFLDREPVVREVGHEQFHEVSEEMQVAKFYEDQRAHAHERGGDPERVTALQVVGDAVADIQRQRALAEEMGPVPAKDGQEAPRNSTHN